MTTPEALNALAYRVEREEPHALLDAAIHAVVHGAMDLQDDLPRYTTSLDAAVTLLPERAEWDLTTLYGVARVAVGLNIDEGPHYATHEGGILPMAICAAALRARAADMQARAEDGAPHPSPSGN